MRTKDLSIFSKITKLAKDQKLEYKILYSYHQKRSTNGHTESYKFILCTNLFTVTYEESFIPENTDAIKAFINNNACIKLDFDIKINTGNDIELTEFR